MRRLLYVVSLFFLISSIPVYASKDPDLIRLESFNDFLSAIIRQTGDRTVLMRGSVEPWPESLPAPERPWYDDGVVHIHYKYVFTPTITGITGAPKILLYSRDTIPYKRIDVYGKLQLFSPIQDSSNTGMILLRAESINEIDAEDINAVSIRDMSSHLSQQGW
ncbi:hypothetical protein [Kistimonas asteriae]|uniref:hypothetical protein n=1 Tax=Kistimonas asteriae TaxID=517724 RepID=UPI001BA44BD5|nr:hypothetical protein [Kistimonas asteriae]